MSPANYAAGLVWPYAEHQPALATPWDLAARAAVLGRTTAGAGMALRAFATVRADGESIRIGRNFFAGERATAHIWDGNLGTTIGDDVTVGRFGLVHACTLADGVVVGEHATVMDASEIGPFAIIGPGSVVPPRKKLPGGWLYAGHPAAPVREVSIEEVKAAAATLRAGRAGALVASDDLPLPGLDGIVENPAAGPLVELRGHRPHVDRAFIAPTAAVAGDVRIADDASVFFGCVVVADGARIVIGRRSNVQDNTFLVTDAAHGDLVVGENVTFGHNVRMGAGRIEDDALIGMASRVAHGVTVERGGCIAAGAWVEAGTVVKANWIWAGRPARAFREVKPGERVAFAEAAAVYVRYGAVYLAQANGAR